MSLLLLLAEGWLPYNQTVYHAEGGLRCSFKANITKVCITTIHGIHSWAEKWFCFPSCFLFPLLYSNKNTISSPFPQQKQVLQKQRQLLMPHSPLFYSYHTCRPLGSPRCHRAKGQQPFRDAWLHIKLLSLSQGTRVNYYSGLSTLMKQFISGQAENHQVRAYCHIPTILCRVFDPDQQSVLYLTKLLHQHLSHCCEQILDKNYLRTTKRYFALQF